MLRFGISGELYAIGSEHVAQVLPLSQYTPLPNTPPYVLGIVSVRGRIVSVLDLRVLFELPRASLSDRSFLLILHSAEMEFGLLIDRVLSGFESGQVSVCVILGTFYSVALMMAGLNFGLVVGAIAGAVTFIPYVGAIIGGVLAIGLALFQFWGDWVSIGIVAGIFAIGQFLEGNIITPKLVGSSVGLHPLWLIFALSAFGTLFGFVGMIVAVPVSAVIGVLVRFALDHYLESTLYQGTEKPVPISDCAIGEVETILGTSTDPSADARPITGTGTVKGAVKGTGTTDV